MISDTQRPPQNRELISKSSPYIKHSLDARDQKTEHNNLYTPYGQAKSIVGEQSKSVKILSVVPLPHENTFLNSAGNLMGGPF